VGPGGEMPRTPRLGAFYSPRSKGGGQGFRSFPRNLPVFFWRISLLATFSGPARQGVFGRVRRWDVVCRGQKEGEMDGAPIHD